MEIKGKNVLVTGGAVRVGAEICRKFAEKGANIVIHYNNSHSDAVLLQKVIMNSYNVICSTVNFDLRDMSDLKAVFKTIGPIDVLVNNASVFKQELLKNELLEDAKEQFEINFWAPWQLMQAFVKQLRGRNGVVLNITDQRVVKNDVAGTSYPLSKKCLSELTMTAAVQLAPKVRVNAVAPGPVLPPVGLKGPGMKLELKNVPLKRPVDLGDLAASCTFLVENESITGQTLFVDCGQHLT